MLIFASIGLQIRYNWYNWSQIRHNRYNGQLINPLRII